jgi:hypothetical protein
LTTRTCICSAPANGGVFPTDLLAEVFFLPEEALSKPAFVAGLKEKPAALKYKPSSCSPKFSSCWKKASACWKKLPACSPKASACWKKL